MKKEYKGTTYKKDTCPICHKKELSYNHFHMNDDSTQITFPWKCRECGATGEEVYTLDFVGHDNIEEKETKTKKAIVNLQRVDYGWVEIEVPNNATDDEIHEAAIQAEIDGKANWSDCSIKATNIVEEYERR